MVPLLRRPAMNAEPVVDSPGSFWRGVIVSVCQVVPLSSFPFYFRHPAFLPSFSLTLLYLTVLSFSGQMVAFLLAVGLTSTHVGIIRAASTVIELGATWTAPWLMARLGSVRAGIWSLSWQMACLGLGVVWYYNGERFGIGGAAPVAGLVGGVALSRLGLWSFDLCAQTIVQEVGLRSGVRIKLESCSLADRRRNRMSTSSSVAGFRLSRRPFRICSSSCHMRRPSSLQGLISFGGRCS